MQPLLKQYLEGTLVSSGPMQPGQVTINNRLVVPVWAGFLMPDGSLYPLFGAPAGKPASQSGPVNYYWLIWALDGSLAAAFQGVPSGALTITIGATDLSAPGDIGPVPTPWAEVPIPNDSPSVLVGTGKGADSEGRATYMTRSQFWKRSGDSITLAPGQKVTTGYTSTTGIQETSSQEETVAKSVNASLAAGWGPVSASLSASLNTSSTSFQQYVSTQTDTRYETRTYEGDETETKMIFRWQLYDVVTVSLTADNKVLAQVTTAHHPDIVKVYREVYREADLATKSRPELPEADRRELNDLLARVHAGGDAQ
jgi:hypothetical protein